MPFPGILGGFETHQKQFFEIFEAKEQKEKTMKNRKISGKLSGNIGNFNGDILSISTDFRYFVDISVEISKILFPGCYGSHTSKSRLPIYLIYVLLIRRFGEQYHHLSALRLQSGIVQSESCVSLAFIRGYLRLAP